MSQDLENKLILTSPAIINESNNMFVNPLVLQRPQLPYVIASKDISVSGVQQLCGLSDHKVQIANFELKIMKCPPNIRYIRSFRMCDWGKLHSAPWHTMDIFDDINDKWFYFCTLLQDCLDKFCRLRRLLFIKQEDLLHGLMILSQKVYKLRIRQNKL